MNSLKIFVLCLIIICIGVIDCLSIKNTNKQKYTGTVKYFVEGKGFGMITPDNGQKDVLVHFSEIVTNGNKILYGGQRVEYEITQSNKGPRASNVKTI
jgi:CspA family cold shock protein